VEEGLENRGGVWRREGGGGVREQGRGVEERRSRRGERTGEGCGGEKEESQG
jgi:hypothetical protein